MCLVGCGSRSLALKKLERDEHRIADAHPKGNGLLDPSDTGLIQIMLSRVTNKIAQHNSILIRYQQRIAILASTVK